MLDIRMDFLLTEDILISSFDCTYIAMSKFLRGNVASSLDIVKDTFLTCVLWGHVIREIGREREGRRESMLNMLLIDDYILKSFHPRGK